MCVCLNKSLSFRYVKKSIFIFGVCVCVNTGFKAQQLLFDVGVHLNFLSNLTREDKLQHFFLLRSAHMISCQNLLVNWRILCSFFRFFFFMFDWSSIQFSYVLLSLTFISIKNKTFIGWHNVVWIACTIIRISFFCFFVIL